MRFFFKATILMNLNGNRSTIMQLLNSAYNDVRFYNFINFSEITENRRYQGYLFLGICRCNTFFLSLLQISGWKFPLGFSLLILIWFAGRDIAVRITEQRKLRSRRKVVCRLSYIWNLRLGRIIGGEKELLPKVLRCGSNLDSATQVFPQLAKGLVLFFCLFHGLLALYTDL